MAFLDFSQPAAGPATSIRPIAVAQAVEPATFDAIEWQVVDLARTDGLASLREPGRFDRLAALLFGRKPDLRLASARLEALRRLAVEAWHRGYAVSLTAIAEFNAAGFNNSQAEILFAIIAKGRAALNQRSRRA